MKSSLTFHGAVGTVTGSCIAVRNGDQTVLVDCGLFQGTKSVRELNYGPLPFDPFRIDAILLTHAHIDHCGLLPKIAASFQRTEDIPPIFCTAATADLLSFMLPDTAHIQEFEVERLNRRNRKRGRPTVEPIYRREHADAVLERIRVIDYGQMFKAAPGFIARFWNAGHILGSASIELALGGDANAPDHRLVFSGDLGPDIKAFHSGPEGPRGVDYLIVESTYGARTRNTPSEQDRRDRLAEEISAALDRGGPILMPVFAVERTQEILYDLDILFDEGRLPELSVFLDSPLAIRATNIFDKHLDAVNETGTPHPFRRENLHPIMEASESRKLERLRGAAIIMAGSGMCDAGRIRHHLSNNLWRKEATVLIVGYQAPGTIGRLLIDGQRRIRIHGESIEVNATVRELSIYSGHADRQGLLAWIEARGPVDKAIFVNHGEPASRQGLSEGLISLGIDSSKIILPKLDERFDLKKSGRPKVHEPGTSRANLEESAERDWHNRYAELNIALSQALANAKDTAERNRILDLVSKAVGFRRR